jgi:hypothetical protein
MKEEEKNDQQNRKPETDQKKKDNTGLKGDDAYMSKNSTAVVDEGDETVTDSDKSKEYDDTDHEHQYKTPGSESEENKEDAENRNREKTSEKVNENARK